LTKNGKITSFILGSKSRDNFLLVFYTAVTMIFFYVISLNRRNYQDVWILDGIAVPTAIFVCFSLVVEMLVQKNKKLVIVATCFLFAMSVIPGLKYQLFYGCFDAPGHYKFTNTIVSFGRVPETEFYSESYGGNPGMHILMSCVSIVSGISVNNVFKFVIPAVLSIVPLIIYFITKDLLSDTIQRCTIIASSFPVIVTYVVWGTSLSMIPYLLLIAIFLRRICMKQYQRELLLLFAILGLGLIISHGVSALFVAFLLMGTPLILKFLEMIRTKTNMSFLSRFPTSTSVVPPLLYVILLATWWMNISYFNLETLAGFVRAIFTGSSMIAPIPTRFYQVPLLAQLQVFTALHLGDFLIAMLSLFGLLTFLRKSRRMEFRDETQAIYLLLTILLGIIVLFLSFQIASSFGAIQYYRFIDYSMPLCTVLAGLTLGQLKGFLERVSSKVVRNISFTFVLFVLVFACLIQFFPYQQLIPKANVLSNDLPKNESIVDLRRVNTPYQKEMISFAERHFFDGRVVADTITKFQTYGFSNSSFFSRVMWPSPLIENLQWDLLMLHTSKAGIFAEKVENRTSESIENIRSKAGNIIYDNGESFIISPMR